MTGGVFSYYTDFNIVRSPDGKEIVLMIVMEDSIS